MNDSQGRIQSTVAFHLCPDTLPISPHCWGLLDKLKLAGLVCFDWSIVGWTSPNVDPRACFKVRSATLLSGCVRLCFPPFHRTGLRGWQKMDHWLLGHSRAGAVCQVARILLFSGAGQGPEWADWHIQEWWRGPKSNQNGKHGIVLFQSRFTCYSPNLKKEMPIIIIYT